MTFNFETLSSLLSPQWLGWLDRLGRGPGRWGGLEAKLRTGKRPVVEVDQPPTVNRV